MDTRVSSPVFARTGALAVAVPLALAALGCNAPGAKKDAPAASSAAAASNAAPAIASAPTASAVASAAPSEPAQAHKDVVTLPAYGWKTYENGRFPFKVDYPTFMTASPPPTNGDGQEWTFGKHATMTASGMNNAANATIQDWYKDAAKRPGVSGKSQSGNSFMVTGVDPSTHKIFWTKTMLVDDVFLTVSLEYEKDLKEAFDPVVAHVAKTWKSTR